MTAITKRGRMWPIVAITVAAAVARLAAIRQPMRFDEAISWAYYVGRSWKAIVTDYSYPNNHVFHSLLARLTGASFRYEPWALRTPALVAGVCIIPLTWLVGRRFADDRTAILGAALTAGSLPLALYSSNARGYSLVTALFLAMLVTAHEASRRPHWKRFAVLTVLGALGLYTVPTMLYPLGVVAIWLAWSAGSQPTVRRKSYLIAACVSMLLAGIIAAVLYAPIIERSGIGVLAANKFVAPSGWGQLAMELQTLVVQAFHEWTSPLPAPVGLLLVLLAAFGIAARPSWKQPSLAVATLVACLVVLTVTRRAPFVRVWLFLVPLWALAVARGAWQLADTIARRPVPGADWAGVCVSVGLCVLLVTTHAIQRDTDTGLYAAAPQVAAMLAPQLGPGDRVFAPIPTNGPLLYYLARAGADTTVMSRAFSDTRRAFLVLQPEQGRTLQWAFAAGLLDLEHWSSPELVGTAGDTELWRALKR